MTMWPRVCASGVGLLMATMLAISCSTAGKPVAQQTTPPSSSAPPTASATPSATPAAPSDEDQVRETVMAFQDAYNTQNWDAYLQLLCGPMRESFTGPAMDSLKKTRTDQGLTQVHGVTAKVDGDKATATLDVQNEVLGRQSIDIPMVREDGWKVCVPSDYKPR